MAQQELKITFTTTVIPKREFEQSLAAAASTEPVKKDVFATQEIDIGGQDFVVAFGRTHVEPPVR